MKNKFNLRKDGFEVFILSQKLLNLFRKDVLKQISKKLNLKDKDVIYLNSKVHGLSNQKFVELFGSVASRNFSSYLKQNKLAFSKFKGFIVTSDQKKILNINT